MAEKKRLANEKSPYLLQHSENPVDWFPWGDLAFERAKEQNRPVFLSIGYSTCHWCHVMAHESFEDLRVAKILNDNFISVKVDREERPEIDSVYMAVCQALTRHAGWPLSIFLTPDKKPFYAATYIPKQGLLELLPQIIRIWNDEKDAVNRSADGIIKFLNNSSDIRTNSYPDLQISEKAFNYLYRNFDTLNGGITGAPKFPLMQNVMYLLRYFKRTGMISALKMCEKTIVSIRMGGIYDQLGYGLHRYSTDEKWFMPHFEKMLYDQAMFVIACTELFLVTKNPDYKIFAEETLDYVIKNLSDESGGFYSAEDADSEGLEGAYYLWSEDEVKKILNKEEFEFASKYFNLETGGNFSDVLGHMPAGKNILYLTKKEGDLEKISEIRTKFLEVREKRVKPFLDDKILTDWNGLMIVALSKASFAFNNDYYLQKASGAADFIINNLLSGEKELLHMYRLRPSKSPGNIDDYAYFIWGLTELYEASFNPSYLGLAVELADTMIENFMDIDNGGFFFSAKNSEKLILNRKIGFDSSYPSSNSVAALNLFRLFSLTGKSEFNEAAIKTVSLFSEQITANPAAHIFFIVALERMNVKQKDVVISSDIPDFLDLLRTEFIPDVNLIVKNSKNYSEIEKICPFTENIPVNAEKVYICSENVCMAPLDLSLKSILHILK